MQSSRIRAVKNDLTDKKFGFLSAKEVVGVDKNGYRLWRCICDCGNEILATSRQLKEGTRKDCGCRKGIRKDLTGKRFGHLTVKYPVGKINSPHISWRCVCDCGKEKDIEGRRLVSGNTKSCGCSATKYVGERFGKLVVLEKTDRRKKSGNSIMLCRCDCGNIIEVATNSLHSGNTKSCGCLKQRATLIS